MDIPSIRISEFFILKSTEAVDVDQNNINNTSSDWG